MDFRGTGAQRILEFFAYVMSKFLKFSGTVAVQKISESITVGHAREF